MNITINIYTGNQPPVTSDPPAPVAEIREPTPEECERIYAFWLNSEGCNGRTLGERMGGLTFNAVRAVMWPKSEGES